MVCEFYISMYQCSWAILWYDILFMSVKDFYYLFKKTKLTTAWNEIYLINILLYNKKKSESFKILL